MNLANELQTMYGIEAFDVLINEEQHIEMEGSLVEIHENADVLRQSMIENKIVEEDIVALESIVNNLEYQLKRGGITRSSVGLANIGLESVTNKYGIYDLGISMEDATADSEGATMSVLTKAKQLLGNLKSNILIAMEKVGDAVDRIRGNIVNIALSLKKRTMSLRAELNKDNKGGKVIKVGGLSKFLTSGSGSVKPEVFLKELNDAIALTEQALGAKSKQDNIAAFVKLCEESIAGNKNLDTKALKAINDSLTKICTITSSKEGTEATTRKYSKTGLGGVTISMDKVDEGFIQRVLEDCKKYYEKCLEITKKKQQGGNVSNESISLSMEDGIGSAAISVVKFVLVRLAAVFMLVHGVVNIGLGIGFGMMFFSPFGLVSALFPIIGGAGALMMGAKLISGGSNRGNVDNSHNDDYGIEDYQISMEAASLNKSDIASLISTFKVVKRNVPSPEQILSLNAAQVKKTCDDVDKLCDQLLTYGKNVIDRRRIVASLPKNIEKLNNSGDKQSAKATSNTARFIKGYLNELIDFEIDLALVQLNVARAAVQYAEISNKE